MQSVYGVCSMAVAHNYFVNYHFLAGAHRQARVKGEEGLSAL